MGPSKKMLNLEVGVGHKTQRGMFCRLRGRVDSLNDRKTVACRDKNKKDPKNFFVFPPPVSSVERMDRAESVVRNKMDTPKTHLTKKVLKTTRVGPGITRRAQLSNNHTKDLKQKQTTKHTPIQSWLISQQLLPMLHTLPLFITPLIVSSTTPWTRSHLVYLVNNFRFVSSPLSLHYIFSPLSPRSLRPIFLV